MTGHANEFRRALAFTAAVDESAATEVRDWSLGRALVTPELPKVWDASYFRVDEPGDGDAGRVAEETTRLARAAGLAHAAVMVAGDDATARLGPGLRGQGFEEGRFALMALRQAPSEPDGDVTEAGFDDVAASRRELTLETFADEELADQLATLDRRLRTTVGGRWFAVRDGGEVISRAWLLAASGVGQVEDVATSAHHRGKGLARAVVSAAARASQAAGNDLTFVIADAGETTPELYRRTGFEPIGFRSRFVKRLDE
jgi:ribosomal protein S18 acetylase RimI-like enzyme